MIESQVKKLERQLSKLEPELSPLNEQLAALNEEEKELRVQLYQLPPRRAVLRAKVQSLTSQIVGFQKKIENLRGELSTEKDIEAFATNSPIFRYLWKKQQEEKKKVRQLEQEMASPEGRKEEQELCRYIGRARTRLIEAGLIPRRQPGDTVEDILKLDISPRIWRQARKNAGVPETQNKTDEQILKGNSPFWERAGGRKQDDDSLLEEKEEDESFVEGRTRSGVFFESLMTIEELEKPEGKPFRFSGTAFRADVESANQRLYPRPVVEAALRELEDGGLDNPTIEMGHPPDENFTSSERIIGQFLSLELDSENYVRFIAELNNTRLGKDAQELLRSRPPGTQPLSLRAGGKMVEEKSDGHKRYRVDELHLFGLDLVRYGGFGKDAVVKNILL